MYKQIKDAAAIPAAAWEPLAHDNMHPAAVAKNKFCTLVAAVAEAHKVDVTAYKQAPIAAVMLVLLPVQYVCCLQLPRRQVGTSCMCRCPPTHKE